MRKIFTLFVLFALTALGAAQAQNLEVDFEKPLADYTDWEFTKMARDTGRDSGGSSVGINSKTENGSGTTGSMMLTKYSIPKPKKLTFRYTKFSSAYSKKSFIRVSVSANGQPYQKVKDSKNASEFGKGEWQAFEVDLTDYANHRIRISFEGTTAIRAIDDIVLTTAEDTPDSHSLTLNPVQSEGKSIHVATFYNTTDNVILPANVKAYTATIEGSKVTTTEFLNGGEVLNAGTPVILMADAAFSGVMETTTTKNTKTTPTNALLGADDNNAITETGKCFYVLTLHPTTSELGFFFQSSNPAGDKLTNHAGKAYLKLDAAQAPAQGFTLGGTVTAIETTTLDTPAAIYDLSGRRVSRAAKGIFIQNGQKKVFN